MVLKKKLLKGGEGKKKFYRGRIFNTHLYIFHISSFTRGYIYMYTSLYCLYTGLAVSTSVFDGLNVKM